MTVWHEAIAEVRALAMVAHPHDELSLIKRFDRILRKLPDAVSEQVGSMPRRELVGSFVDSGALESAVIALIGSRCGYLLTQSQEGLSSAVVTIDGSGYEPGFFSISPVFALIGAYCETLLKIVKGDGSSDIDVVKFIHH